jgi:hypothetical protein
MSDDKPNPFDDLRRGLGLLFRAARTTVERLPKAPLEDVVLTSAREVGRAIENVGKTIEREVFGRKGGDGERDPQEPRPPENSDRPRDPGRDDRGPPDAA